MKRRIALILAVVFMFVLAAGMFYGNVRADEKTKSSNCTMHKEGSCQHDKAQCQEKCKEQGKEQCLEKCKEQCKEKSQEQPKSACKQSSCTKSCPAASACQKAEESKK